MSHDDFRQADARPSGRTGPATDPPDPIAAAVAASRRPRLTPHEIAWMLASVARIPAVLVCARGRLDTTLFDSSEARFVLVWRAVAAAAADGRGVLPADAAVARELVALKCAAELAADPARLFYTPAVERSVLADGGLLDEMFALPVSTETEEQGLSLLARFVVERVVADPLRRAFAGLNPHETVADPADLVARIEAHVRGVAGLGVDPGGPGVVDRDDFVPTGADTTSTGMRWLDALLNGGHAAKECYALLGPTSGGKSALAVQLAVNGAEFQAALAADVGPDEAGHWYYISWELSRDVQLLPRIYAYGARVSLDTIADMAQAKKECDRLVRRGGAVPSGLAGRLEFSTAERPETLKPYEYDPLVNPPGLPPAGERERIAGLRRRLSGANARLHVVDYSGTYPGTGTGGVEEVVTYLRRAAARGQRIAGVVLDYAGLAVNRLIGHRRLDPAAEYNLLASFVDTARSQIAVPFACPVWVLHQLHGDVTRRAPGAKVHHADARGCRNFADNADFGLQLSPYSRVTGLLTVHCTKHRRAKGVEEGSVCRFDGRFGAFLDPDQDYVVDPQTKQIVPKDFLDKLPVGPAARPGAAPAPPPVDPLKGIT